MERGGGLEGQSAKPLSPSRSERVFSLGCRVASGVDHRLPTGIVLCSLSFYTHHISTTTSRFYTNICPDTHCEVMEILTRMASSDNPLKRALDEPDSVPRMNFLSNNHTQSTLTPPNTESPDSKPLAGMESFLREPSPALSTSTLSSLPASANGSVSAQPATSGTPSAHPAKRRKLTAEEKAQLQMEKDAKAREREQKKAQKEAENAAKEAVKEEERRVKAEKKRQEAEVKEEKQRVKDLAKKQKEEEEAKKQRVRQSQNMHSGALLSSNRHNFVSDHFSRKRHQQSQQSWRQS